MSVATFALSSLTEYLFTMMWTMLRISGVVLVAPVLGSALVPVRVRILIAVVLSLAVMPLTGPLPEYSPLSLPGLLAIAREIGIGMAMGFVLLLALDAAVIAGQVVSMGMGLAFATVVDPNSGGVPLLGRFYLVVATLLMLAFDAHLMLIEALARSFVLLPVGAIETGLPGAAAVVAFGAVMFAAAIQLALPGVVAILMVNMAFGVISRAAPTLNLFAVGFPVAILMGFVVLVFGIGNHGAFWELHLSRAFEVIAVAGGAP